MFTKNFINMLVHQQFFGTGSVSVDGVNFKSPLSSTSCSTTWSNYYSIYEKIMTKLCTSMEGGKYGVAFGSDGTAETEDDYKFANGCFSDITMTISNSSGTKDENGGLATKEYVIVNNSSEEITIREVGLWWYSLLLERTVLDNPVTIAAGGVGVIKYSLRYNYQQYPTA